jgi:hypothetical protein
MVIVATSPNLYAKQYLNFATFTYCNLYTRTHLESNIMQSNKIVKYLIKVFYICDNTTDKIQSI